MVGNGTDFTKLNLSSCFSFVIVMMISWVWENKNSLCFFSPIKTINYQCEMFSLKPFFSPCQASEGNKTKQKLWKNFNNRNSEHKNDHHSPVLSFLNIKKTLQTVPLSYRHGSFPVWIWGLLLMHLYRHIDFFWLSWCLGTAVIVSSATRAAWLILRTHRQRIQPGTSSVCRL